MSRPDAPTVSVVVPTYDRGGVLGRAIASVLSQTVEDLELLVIDGGSTDGTRSVVEGFEDDRLRYVRFEENEGPNVARNHGIDRSRGEYVAFLDSDDAFTETYLERSLGALAGAPRSVVGSYGSRVWYRGGVEWNLTVADTDVSHDDLRRKNVVGGFSNVVFRSRTLQRVGGADTALRYCDDYDLFLRATEPDRRLRAARDAVVDYHIHDSGAPRLSDQLERRVTGHRQFLERHRDRLGPAGVANQQYQIGMAHVRDGDVRAARRYFGRGVRNDPTGWRHWYHFLASLGGVRALRAAAGLKIHVKRHVYRAIHGL